MFGTCSEAGGHDAAVKSNVVVSGGVFDYDYRDQKCMSLYSLCK